MTKLKQYFLFEQKHNELRAADSIYDLAPELHFKLASTQGTADSLDKADSLVTLNGISLAPPHL